MQAVFEITHAPLLLQYLVRRDMQLSEFVGIFTVVKAFEDALRENGSKGSVYLPVNREKSIFHLVVEENGYFEGVVINRNGTIETTMSMPEMGCPYTTVEFTAESFIKTLTDVRIELDVSEIPVVSGWHRMNSDEFLRLCEFFHQFSRFSGWTAAPGYLLSGCTNRLRNAFFCVGLTPTLDFFEKTVDELPAGFPMLTPL